MVRLICFTPFIMNISLKLIIKKKSPPPNIGFQMESKWSKQVVSSFSERETKNRIGYPMGVEGSHGQETQGCSELLWFCSLNHDCLGVTESPLKQDEEDSEKNPRYTRFLKQAMVFSWLACY